MTLPSITFLIVVGTKYLSISIPLLLISAFALTWSEYLLSNRKNERDKVFSALIFNFQFDEAYLELSFIKFPVPSMFVINVSECVVSISFCVPIL